MPSSNSNVLSTRKILLDEFQLEMASAIKDRKSTDALRASLKSLERPEVFELLAESLEIEGFDDSNTYWTCIYDLQNRPESETFEICQSWTNSKRPKLRRAACGVLGQLGYNACLPFKTSSQPLLERLLADIDPEVVTAALFALGKLDVGNLELILPHAKHPDPMVRHAVAYALLSRYEPMANRILIELSTDLETTVRDWATFGLGSEDRDDLPEIREALAARLGDEDSDTRGEAIIGLAQRKDPRVVAVIQKELGSDSVGTLTLQAIEEMPNKTFIESLEKWLALNPGDEELLSALKACNSI
jgi:HEAT repeat protein